MKRFLVAAAVCVAGAFLAGVLCPWVSPPAARAQDTAPASTQPALSWAEGVEKVRVGKYEEGLAILRQAAAAAPDNPKAVAGVRLLQDYLSLSGTWDKERAKEFDRAADRVRRSLLVQARLPELTEANVDKPLREKVSQIDQQFARLMNSDALDQAQPEQVKDAKAKAHEAALKWLDLIPEMLEALKPLPADDSYAVTFRGLADQLKGRITAYVKVWESVRTDTVKDLREGAKVLGPVEDDLIDALTDVDGMVTDQPWRAGLSQARLARTVAPQPNKMDEYGWYKELVQSAAARAEEALKDGRWYDAMAVYNALHDLDGDSQVYRDRLRDARRHVRVLSLYGRKRDSNAATGPDDDARWQELTEGVDAHIVHSAISQLDDQYVAAVDYRQLARGSLTAIKTLAATPEAANSFEGLRDAGKKKAFVEGLDRELANVNQNDRVDHLYLSMALNAVLRESERSVNIPLGVLAVEFTDGFLEEMDKFSQMIWPSEVDDFKKHTMGQFYGVGIRIAKEPNEPLRVVEPLAESPAYREGIKGGDSIVTVDGKATEPLSVDKLVRLIQGPKGTKVVLGIRSRGQTQVREVTLIRDEIRIHTVKGWRLEQGGDGDNWQFLVDERSKIAYIRITQFTEDTPAALDRALTQLRKVGCRSLILDLRYNPGGLLESSQQVVDEFLNEGRIVVTRGRQKVQKEYVAHEGGEYVGGNLVVLVNEMSASASEIVSGALQDNHRALIVGQRSYGKGSVQNVIQVPGHAAYLKLTTAYYYLPSGRLLHRRDGEKTWGVDPDVEVRMTPRQTRRWLAMQRRTELLQEIDAKELTRDLAEEFQADLPLNTAVFILKMMQLQANDAAS